MLVNLLIFLTILPLSFSQLPTSMPTSVPSTISPTEIPTFIPTVVPTFMPTEIPTAVPTFMPTEIPTAVPTVVPTVVPTEIPTVQFTVPTLAPTYFPTVQIGSDMIVFGLELSIEGVSADDIISDVVAQQTIEEATCNSMGNGVTVNMCKFISALDTTSRRLSGRKLTSSCDVNIQANVPISQVSGGNNDAEDSYELLSNSISTAASNGDLTQAIQTAATEDGSSILISATSNYVTEEPYTEYDSTPTPSASPSISPNNSSPSSSDDDQISDGEIVAVTITSIVGVIFFYVIFTRFIFSRNDSSRNMTTIPFRKPAEHDAANIL